MVPGRQVRHLHPLGRLLGAGLRQRVVPAEHVQGRTRRSSSTTSRPTGRRRSSATRTSSRSSRPSGSTRDAGPELFKDAGAKFVVPVAEHHDGFPCTTTAFTDWSRREDGAEARRDRRARRSRARRGPGLRRFVPPRRALVVLRPGNDVRLRRARSRQRRPLRPGPRPEGGGEPDSAPEQAFLDDWLLRTCEIVDQYQPQLIWFDWWIAQPAFQTHLQQFAAFYYNRGVGVEAGRRHQLQEARRRVVPRQRRRPRHRARPARGHPAQLLADRHRGLEELLGLRRRTRTTRPPTASSTTSWTS